ncbi:MAG: alanine racemase [Ekhidna sp.]
MEIRTPTLLIDKEKCLRNIDKMQAKAANSNAGLRPHFKTHVSAEIGNWYREKGVEKCTVSSVSMAKYFAENNWSDITIAFPYNPLEAEEISKIGDQTNLNILIESKESLEHATTNLTKNVGFFIKVDVGTHRTGVDPRDESLIQFLIANATEKLQFRGFLAHAGHSYGCRDLDSIQWIFDGAKKTLTHLHEKFGGIISYGDTPSCSLMEDFSFCDELRPGNFLFYDWMQHNIGSCNVEEIAVCMACPVVAIHPERNEVVIYGGGVHLSKDMIVEKDLLGKDLRCFGKMVALEKGGWNTKILGNVVRLSQEHGIIKLPDEEITHVKVGDIIGVIPVHSCLTVDLQGHYLSTTGESIEKMTKN